MPAVFLPTAGRTSIYRSSIEQLCLDLYGWITCTRTLCVQQIRREHTKIRFTRNNKGSIYLINRVMTPITAHDYYLMQLVVRHYSGSGQEQKLNDMTFAQHLENARENEEGCMRDARRWYGE